VVGKGCAKCGSFGTVTGGETPYSYKVTGGAIPSGMSRNALSLVGGFPAGSYGLTVQVTDKFGATASVQAHWSIYSPAKLTAGSSCTDNVTGACTATAWFYSGGNPNVAPKVVVVKTSVGALPPGWSVSAKSGALQISAGPIVCNTPGYVGTITLALSDTSACPTTATSNLVDLSVNISNNC